MLAAVAAVDELGRFTSGWVRSFGINNEVPLPRLPDAVVTKGGMIMVGAMSESEAAGGITAE